MKRFAVIESGIVANVIMAYTLEDAMSATKSLCIEEADGISFAIDQKLDAKQIAEIEKAKAKKETDAKKAADKAEADRVKAIEAENERLRKAEADRIAAEEASKPEPVTGIFVKVEKN